MPSSPHAEAPRAPGSGRPGAGPVEAGLGAWTLLAALAVLWGTAFLFTEVALRQVPPTTLAATRLVLAALLLNGVRVAVGCPLPAAGRIWWRLLGMALAGSALPFLLIGWGQEQVPSGTAGILMAVMPLATLALAQLWLEDEPLGVRRLGGFVLGFAGVVVLFGPSELPGDGLPPLRGLAILGGAFCYAVNTILARKVGAVPPLAAASAALLLASALLAPVALAVDRPWALPLEPVPSAALVWLAVGPTALGAAVHLRLVSRAGAGFASLSNYAIPVVAVLAGAAFLGERLAPEAALALALVLGGIALGRSSAGAAAPRARGAVAGRRPLLASSERRG